MMRKIRSVATLAVGLVAVALAASLVTTSASTTTSGWVTFGPAPPGATAQTIAGTSDGQGGCSFVFSALLSPGQTMQRADEIAYNASTCQVQVAFTNGASAPPEPAFPSGGSGADSGSVDSQLSGSAPAAASSIHSAGYYKSWFEDPIGLVVNSVKNGTDWHWNRKCVVPPVSGSFNYWWRSGTGWLLLQNNWQNVYTCAESTSSSYAHFYNPSFCNNTPTDVVYNRNTVHGEANGDLVGTAHVSKFGICSPLLSFHAVLKRTLN
jgi:hypothetical protein